MSAYRANVAQWVIAALLATALGCALVRAYPPVAVECGCRGGPRAEEPVQGRWGGPWGGR